MPHCIVLSARKNAESNQVLHVHAPDKEHVTKNKVKLIPDLSTSEVQLIIHRKTQICHF